MLPGRSLYMKNGNNDRKDDRRAFEGFKRFISLRNNGNVITSTNKVKPIITTNQLGVLRKPLELLELDRIVGTLSRFAGRQAEKWKMASTTELMPRGYVFKKTDENGTDVWREIPETVELLELGPRYHYLLHTSHPNYCFAGRSDERAFIYLPPLEDISENTPEHYLQKYPALPKPEDHDRDYHKNVLWISMKRNGKDTLIEIPGTRDLCYFIELYRKEILKGDPNVELRLPRSNVKDYVKTENCLQWMKDWRIKVEDKDKPTIESEKPTEDVIENYQKDSINANDLRLKVLKSPNLWDEEERERARLEQLWKPKQKQREPENPTMAGGAGPSNQGATKSCTCSIM